MSSPMANVGTGGCTAPISTNAESTTQVARLSKPTLRLLPGGNASARMSCFSHSLSRPLTPKRCSTSSRECPVCLPGLLCRASELCPAWSAREQSSGLPLRSGNAFSETRAWMGSHGPWAAGAQLQVRQPAGLQSGASAPPSNAVLFPAPSCQHSGP